MRSWWKLSGPSRARPAEELFRHPEVRAARVVTYRRLFRVGPYSVGLMRYGPPRDPR